eukprot:TRINITY_DN5162_c0_g1_i6.p1 TRINITY_DN5162_c0_g1~~TRINITY_DN5162_c0_g1_i6.p1  ORF type:complete len:379 (+),score=43.57 TRINITY_DN5162_c0_g1_i6:66-1202(+)
MCIRDSLKIVMFAQRRFVISGLMIQNLTFAFPIYFKSLECGYQKMNLGEKKLVSDCTFLRISDYEFRVDVSTGIDGLTSSLPSAAGPEVDEELTKLEKKIITKFNIKSEDVPTKKEKGYTRLSKLIESQSIPANSKQKAHTRSDDKRKTKHTLDCPICLGEIQGKKGKLACRHEFCLGCIKDWSQVTNLCPLCKKDFKEILIGDLLKGYSDVKIKVKPRRQMNEGTEIEFVIDDNCDDECYVCHQKNDFGNLLVCDECNWSCCHLYCESPPLISVPTGKWFCASCKDCSATRSRRRRNSTRQKTHKEIPTTPNVETRKIPDSRTSNTSSKKERPFASLSRLLARYEEGTERATQATSNDEDVIMVTELSDISKYRYHR